MSGRATEVFAFGLLDTLARPGALAASLEAEGVGSDVLPLWLARTSRDGYALAASEQYRTYLDTARGALSGVLAERGSRLPDEAMERLLSGFAGLEGHRDARAGLGAARETGARVVVLTNLDEDTARRLLARLDLLAFVDSVVSTEVAHRWKPHPLAFLAVAKAEGVDPTAVSVVSAHPEELAGARAIGMRTGYVARTRSATRVHFDADAVEGSLRRVVRALAA